MKENKDILDENINEIEKSTFRVNITMATEMVDFFQDMSNSMGIPRSTCMVIALKTYMDQQNMLKLTNQLNKL